MSDLDAGSLAKIKSIVRETLAADFDGVRVIDVFVNEDTDSDGEHVLRIDVIFSGKAKNLDARKLSGVIRQLRPKLDEIDVSAFPMMSYISEADAKKRASA